MCSFSYLLHLTVDNACSLIISCSKTAIAIDTIINQQRFNYGDDESKLFKQALYFDTETVHFPHSEEAVLYLRGHWSEEEYRRSDCQKTH